MEELGRGAALFAMGLSLAVGCSSESTTDGPDTPNGAVAGTHWGAQHRNHGERFDDRCVRHSGLERQHDVHDGGSDGDDGHDGRRRDEHRIARPAGLYG